MSISKKVLKEAVFQKYYLKSIIRKVYVIDKINIEVRNKKEKS